MKKLEFKVRGMHCRSCEMLVNDEVGEIPGVRSVGADHVRGIVRVNAEDGVDVGNIKAKITALGYEVLEDGKKD